MNNYGKTIAAVSTPPGKGGVALIRVSGSDALNIAEKCFFPASGKKLGEIQSNYAVYGVVSDSDGRKIDDGIAVIYRAPRSFTGEDTVEISCHGGVLVTRQVLETLFLAGAEMAQAGEFTRRAFLSGKISLTEAEAIGDLLDAKSLQQVYLAGVDSRTRLAEEISGIHDELILLLSTMYAKIDFPDEDLADIASPVLAEKLNEISGRLGHLIRTYRTGHAVNEGISTVICGAPNVGKSSLYNLICGGDFAIVTEYAGTTRDVLERTVPLDKVLLRLYDTAGIHDATDPVEKLGVERSGMMADKCELLLAVFDASRKLSDDDRAIIRRVCASNASRVALINKCDLPKMIEDDEIREAFDEVICISANDPSSRDTLEALVERLFTDEKISLSNDAVVSSARQFTALSKAGEYIASASALLLEGLPFDIASSDIERAAGELSGLDGRGVSSDIVDTIFSRFCVGK